jgi:hypothetical protein
MRTLAADETGAWSLVFIADELPLFVGCAAKGTEPDPVESMTLEDFLVTIPDNSLHQQAHEALVELLRQLIA